MPPEAASARARAAGTLMVLGSAVVWPCMDAIAKHLAAAGWPTSQIAWGRYLASVALLAPAVLARHGARALLPPPRPLHLLRVALPVGVTVLLFHGFAHMPFAEASALLFVNPLLVTALSGPVLGERVGPERWLAVAAGFAGALLVVRPGTDVFTWHSLAPLGAAACFAASVVLNRRLKGDVPPLATTLHFGVVASVGLLPFAAGGGWRPFDAPFAGWLLLMAVFGGLALWLITAGYERAEASFLAPLHYVELACATAIGVLVFGEVPGLAAGAGIALIVAAGLWVALRPGDAPAPPSGDRAGRGEVRLRPATPADLPLLRRWDEQPHVVASDPNDDWGWEVELARRPDWREQLVAEEDGRPVGFVQIIDPAREESRYWGDCPPRLRALDVWIGEPDDLGRGLGTEMMRLALARCFADPEVEAVLLDPLESNVRARRFYERLGFRFVERRRFGLDDCAVYRLDRAGWRG